jgi:hypothetical protein
LQRQAQIAAEGFTLLRAGRLQLATNLFALLLLLQRAQRCPALGVGYNDGGGQASARRDQDRDGQQGFDIHGVHF